MFSKKGLKSLMICLQLIFVSACSSGGKEQDRVPASPGQVDNAGSGVFSAECKVPKDSDLEKSFASAYVKNGNSSFYLPQEKCSDIYEGGGAGGGLVACELNEFQKVVLNFYTGSRSIKLGEAWIANVKKQDFSGDSLRENYIENLQVECRHIRKPKYLCDISNVKNKIFKAYLKGIKEENTGTKYPAVLSSKNKNILVVYDDQISSSVSIHLSGVVSTADLEILKEEKKTKFHFKNGSWHLRGTPNHLALSIPCSEAGDFKPDWR